VGKGKRRKKFSTLPSPMSTRCQYVEREREGEKKGNLSTQADQYHSAVVALSFFLFFICCYWTKLDFNHSQLCAKSTTTNCNNNNNNNNNNNDDTAFLYSPVIVCRM